MLQSGISVAFGRGQMVCNGSKTAANFRDRHGRTCFNTGRQGTQPLRRFLIDEMTVSTIGKHHARSTPETGRHGRRPASPVWAKCRHRAPIPSAHAKGVALYESCRRNHEREWSMNVQRRDFLLLVTLATAAATPALGQAAPAVSNSGAQSAASIPDFSGIWSHPYFPGIEPPASGPGPVTNRLRLPSGQIDPDHLVGDYTNPVLKPAAAEAVRQHGEMEVSGVGAPTPSNQCWPEPVPYIFWNWEMQMLQAGGQDHDPLSVRS
jgi:hypothetical protein